MPAILTLWGLFQWDNTLFDKLYVPSMIVKDDLINNILLECAELEVVYPDPVFLKTAIASWSMARLTSWKRYATLQEVEYDPLNNTQRNTVIKTSENEHDTRTGSENLSKTITSHEENSAKGTEKNSVSRAKNITTINSVSAFDAEQFSNSNRQAEETGEDQDTIYNADTANRVSKTDNDTHKIDTTNEKHHSNEQTKTINSSGKIGVTLYQTIMQGEVDFWKWDIIHQISQEFRRNFCISVY